MINPEGYLVKNANTANKKERKKNFEFFLTANTVRYRAQIEKETPGISVKPTPEKNNTIGKVAKSKPPKKLSRVLNLNLKKKYNPKTPKT